MSAPMHSTWRIVLQKYRVYGLYWGEQREREGGNGARQHCSLPRLRALVRGWRRPRPVSVPEDRKGAMREGWRRQTGSSPQRLR